MISSPLEGGLRLNRVRLVARAVLTDTVKAEGVVGQFKISLFGDFVLQGFDGGIIELLNAATLHTDQVIMMIPSVEFEYGVAALEMMANHQSRGFKLGQDPVDRSQSDFFSLIHQGAKNVFRTQMLGGVRSFKNFQNLDSWERDLEACIPDVFAFQISLLMRCESGPDRV